MVLYRHLGYGTTNANGVATLDHAPDGTAMTHSYTGIGAGNLQIVAKSEGLESEAYDLLDAIYYDDCSTDTKAKYYVNTTDGTTKTYDNSAIKITCGTNASRNFVYLRTNENSGLLALLQGKTVKFKADISGITDKTVQARIRYNGSTSTSYSSITGDGTIETDSLTIPLDATGVTFEIIPTSFAENDTYFVKNFTVYVS